MKALLYVHETPLGAFWIRPEPAGRVQLGLGRLKIRTYSSAKAAAQAVAERQTGLQSWDEARDVLAPSGLEKWKRGAVHQRRRKKASGEDGLNLSDPSES